MPRCHHLGRSVRPVTKEGRKRWAWVRGVCACPYHLGERKGFHIRSGSAWAEHLKILTLRSAPERSIRIFKCSAGALRILNAATEHLEFQMLLSNTPPEHLLGPYGFKEGQISWIWSVNSSIRGVYNATSSLPYYTTQNNPLPCHTIQHDPFLIIPFNTVHSLPYFTTQLLSFHTGCFFLTGPS